MMRLPFPASLAPLVAAALLFVSFSLSREARADEQPWMPARLHLGPRVTLYPQALEIDGRSQPSDGTSSGYGVNGAFRYHFLPWLGAEVSGSISRFSSEWSERRGETRTRADLAAGPLFIHTFPTSKFQVQLRFALPVGITWVWFDEGPERAVIEQYQTGRGFTVTLVGGLDIFFVGPHGAYLDLGLGGGAFSVQHSATLKADPTVRSTEQYRYSGTTALIGGGYAYRF